MDLARVTAYRRPCACDHGFPLCACREGWTGDALLARSRLLSSYAGWPARVGVADAVRVLVAELRPLPPSSPDGDCGCGGRA